MGETTSIKHDGGPSAARHFNSFVPGNATFSPFPKVNRGATSHAVPRTSETRPESQAGLQAVEEDEDSAAGRYIYPTPAPALALSSAGTEQVSAWDASTTHSSGGDGAQSGGLSSLLRRRLYVFGGAVLIALVSGFIGGIAGWQITLSKARDAATGGSTGRGCRASSTDGAAALIRPGATLAATGYRFLPDFHVSLYYQGPDNRLRVSKFDSRWGVWSVPLALSVKSQSTGTPLAAGTFIVQERDNQYSQTELFWDAGGKLDGRNWRGGEVTDGMQDSIGQADIETTPPTGLIGAAAGLSAYWPLLVAQDGSSGALRGIQFNYTAKAWMDERLSHGPTNAMRGSPLLVLPLDTAHTTGYFQVFYRPESGGLARYYHMADGAVAKSGTKDLPLAVKWPSSRAGALAGFVFVNNGGAVVTVLLWQDDTGEVRFASRDGEGVAEDSDKTWSEPATDAVFAGADNPTGLACVTAAASPWRDAVSVPLVAGKTDMNLCYFQVRGALKEVRYDGDRWVDLGFINMPAVT